MNSLLRQGWDWVLRVYDRLTGDIFLAARAKILFSYIVIGVIVTGVVGYLIYRNTISVAQEIIAAVQLMLEQNAAASKAAITNSTIQLINAQIWRANILIGLFMFLILGAYAYVLARATLRPIQRAMDRQRRFAANVAHELRTPLSAMKTNFEVALMGSAAEAEGEFPDALRSGIEEIDRMTAIAQFLLNFSSFDERGAKLEMSEIDLSALVRDALHHLKPFLGRREVEVQVFCQAPIMVYGNPTALHEMVLNLTKNAVAYTPAHGIVTIATGVEHRLPTLTVRDTGIGIPPGDISKIFEPFYRGTNAYSQRSKKRGSGLGLAIVKEIVKLHNAHIVVQSELGKGTKVSVHFPPR